MSKGTIKTNVRGEPEEPVDNLDALNLALERLAADNKSRPIVVDLVRNNGDSLSFGIGADLTALSFTPADGGACMASIGDPAVAAGPRQFISGGHWTEVRSKHLIPMTLAVEEIRHWFQHGVLGLGPIKWRTC